ncbi:hypothetical protein Pmani_026720 [Petrolisthes manimaculis]|uniref:CARMIL pleckstrin homology domain-containing protein n=1 Tax=Petrolisthes manimaculis TaxID=1843537 RepID=A0AAE1P5G6_9EUCA|nr:hypothetical protein Pmani_026720 [Petrolisthes manimaculis]
MTGRNIITRELSDSIRQCLGRKVKLTLKVLVKVETRGDKTDNRVLAFASCRLFVLTAKVPTRVDQHFHYLDIQGIESRKPNQQQQQQPHPVTMQKAEREQSIGSGGRGGVYSETRGCVCVCQEG